MRVYYDRDADLNLIKAKKVAVIGYGSTESGGLVALKALSASEATSWPATCVGAVRDDLEVRIGNRFDEEVAAGETGEILVRPRMPYVISDGYYGLPEKALEARRNLWLHTGDLGYMETNERLHFVGRAREAIRVGGAFVPVEYLENLIRSLEEVVDCAVVGVPAELGDEEIRLFVQRRTPAELSADCVMSYLRAKVPKFMLPKSVEFLPAFPRSPGTLKIQKNKLVSL